MSGKPTNRDLAELDRGRPNLNSPFLVYSAVNAHSEMLGQQIVSNATNEARQRPGQGVQNRGEKYL